MKTMGYKGMVIVLFSMFVVGVSEQIGRGKPVFR